MKKQRFILHAPNVHTGGGKVLLDQLLGALSNKNIHLFANLDKRYQLSENVNVSTRYFYSNTLVDRLKAELQLKKIATDDSIVLCFGNLPPLFRLEAKVFVYFQNRCILSNNLFLKYPIKMAFRLLLEKLWLVLTKSHCDQFIVQSHTMRQQLKQKFTISKPIEIKPFLDLPEKTSTQQKQFDYIYAASQDPHKNHQTLLDAWVHLAKNNQYPSLALTLPKRAPIAKQFEQTKLIHNLNITNLGPVNYSEMVSTYQSAHALIYPSFYESFGLPLLEAASVGLDIIAPELDYVRDVVSPKETFDPNSALSIARAVERHNGMVNSPREIYSAEAFIDSLIK